LKNPSEIQLLKDVYGDVLWIVGVFESWLGLFEQFSGFYKWSLCRV
jgi:hypothetical protein